ncbi:cyclin domain protein, putative [Bodo saltans]|uniref:Cyclin domain protein, putative n=1 Tax=Bodo saltans TaxID=75058 RepID=A0A0S4IIC5_BODSA|nr:cyclin domain protein, putative [Bodo saltans]|eukprot:CUE71409.1 cyclin domain protein, putative [Bodo saltans]
MLASETKTALEKALEEEPIHVNLFLYGLCIGEVGTMELQSHIFKYPNIRILELKGSTIGRRGAIHLAKCLPSSQLSHLGLGRNSLDVQAATTVIDSLVGVPLETLDLESNALPDAVAVSLANLLAKTKTLASVTLERNDLRSEGISAIANALRENTSLLNLNLAFNRCGAAACEALGDMLEVNKTLLTLNVMQCSVTVEAARHIARGVTANHTLQSLNLQLNQAIDAFSGKSAGGAQYPVSLNASLRELNFGSNRISSYAVESFGRVLGGATSLVALSLGKCLFGEPAVRHIIQNCALLTNLVTLDLSNCLMGAASGELLSNLLTRCPNIHSLYLDDNPLGRFGIEAISAGLPFCRALVCLSLCRCDIGKEGMPALATALRKRSGLPLRELRLSSNHLGYDGLLLLCDALVNMRDDSSQYLEALDLSDNGIGGRTCAYLAAVLQAHRNSLLSITLRDNPISEEMKQNYLTFESALAYTGGIISDPTLKLGQQEGQGVKATFEMDKTQRGGPTSPAGSPTRTGALSSGLKSPSSPQQQTALQRKYSNFNGSSATALGSNDLEVLPSSPGGRRRSSVASPDRRLSVVPQEATVVEEPVPAASPITAANEAYIPGFSPIVPQFKQRHMLHDVEENISQLPISDTQLRIKFTQLDASCVGYLTVSSCLQALRDLDACVMDFTSRKLKERAMQLCPDGRVTYEKFCLLVLPLVSQ